MSYTRAEREHIVRISDDPEDGLTFYTHSETWARRLRAKGAKLKKVSSVEGREVSWTLTAPREWFRVPGPKKRVSTLQRELAGARLKALHAKKAAASSEPV